MKKRILFVDDEPNILKGLQRSLRPMRNDWDMSFAQGPESALELLAQTSFDVIVSDMNMPGMDGGGLMAIVKKKHPQMYRILLSGNCESGAPLYGADDMADYFLSKPCEKASLIQVINQSVRQSGSQAVRPADKMMH